VHRDIERLMRVMPPTELSGDLVDWAEAEEEWNLRFPEEFKDFVTVYGAGFVSGYLVVGSPASAPTGTEAVDLEMLTPSEEELVAAESPFPALPSPGGLLGLGATPDGDSLYLLTDPEAGDWKVVTWTRSARIRDSNWTLHEMGISGFLLQLFRRTLPKNPFGGSDLWGIEAPRFIHWRDIEKAQAVGLDPWS